MDQPLICMTLTGKTLEEDYKLVRKYEKLIDIVELRVDHLTEEEQLYVKRFPAMINLPCILTIRRDVDGGLFTGGEFSRSNLFGRALAFADPDKSKNFAYVDFEEDYHVPSMQDAAMAFGVRIIRSCHNMTNPVTNLREKCESMRKTGYEIPKIAFMPNTLSDVVNLFKEGESITGYDHIFCAMGPLGFPSRVLSTFSNSYLTFVSPEEMLANTTGIGHIDPVTINDLYHFKNITKETSLFGITGWPLKSTSSPAIHNRGFVKYGMNSVFLPVRSPQISEALSFSEKMNFKGLVISSPFKESVLNYLNEQNSEVIQIGSCDTLLRRNGKWTGFNTDYLGFKKALQEFLGNFSPKRKKVAVIGAGGTAKSIAFSLKQLGAKVCIFNRTLEHAQFLAEKYGFEYCQLDQYCVEKLDEFSTLIIQATSVGMNENGSSTPENDPIYFYNFRGNELVFDLIYSPSVTPLMKRASLEGCRTCNGYKMLEYKGYEQFKLFTNKNYEN